MKQLDRLAVSIFLFCIVFFSILFTANFPTSKPISTDTTSISNKIIFQILNPKNFSIDKKENWKEKEGTLDFIDTPSRSNNETDSEFKKISFIENVKKNLKNLKKKE
eukprot:TRINITY_DN2575_c1_g1_i4.p1 TRINITY_DN2575_c1_g1~~TRINITY_DN2575_c1_g1_i4.p1  ORF type:complete len:107 (-),score=13.69 TRINITY_DN2575_c1_g1_i4:362-682(-)